MLQSRSCRLAPRALIAVLVILLIAVFVAPPPAVVALADRALLALVLIVPWDLLRRLIR